MPLNLTSDQIEASCADSVTTFYCYEIWYSETQCLRYTNYRQIDTYGASIPVTYDGNTYTFAPIQHSSITQGTDGKINDVTVSIGNADRIIQSYLEDEDYWILGNKCRIIQLFKDIPAGIEMTLRIKKASCKKDIATFTLGLAVDALKLELPGRKIMSRFCWWAFKDDDCGYSGADTECDRSFDDCKSKGNLSRFGGFPGVLHERFYF